MVNVYATIHYYLESSRSKSGRLRYRKGCCGAIKYQKRYNVRGNQDRVVSNLLLVDCEKCKEHPKYQRHKIILELEFEGSNSHFMAALDKGEAK